MRAVVVAGAPVESSRLVDEALTGADLLIAADGGAARLLELGSRPHIVVGDMDSISAEVRERLRSAGSEVIWHPSAKDKTDSHLALALAFDRGAEHVDMMGLFGGERLDHGIANSLLMAMSEFRDKSVRIIEGLGEARLCRGETRVAGKAGDYLTLMSLSAEVTGIRSEGLRYEVPQGRLAFGDSLGVSNELTGTEASVTAAAGILLLIHQHRA
jgi:thiamine pyrophosphokinase